MSSLLTPDFGLLFWMVISFLIVLFLLARFGFPVITKSVDKRSEYITHSLQVADEANARLASIKVEGDELIDGARKQQAAILKKAAADGDGIVRSAQDKAAAETQKQVEAARAQLAMQKQKAMDEINTEVTDMVIAVAEKVLRAKLENPEEEQKLISRMLDEMAALNAKGSQTIN